MPVAIVLTHNEKLGDAVLRIPFYRALRLAFPDHRIVCVSAENTVWLNTLAAVRAEFIDEIHVDQALDSVLQVRALIKRFGPVDLVFDLRSNKRTPKSFLGTLGLTRRYIGNSAGFIARHGIAGLYEDRPTTNARRWHRMVELAASRLLPFDAKLPVVEKARALAQHLVPDSRFLCLSPGPGVNKFWDAQKWSGLADHVASLGIVPIFLLGPQEIDQRQWIRHRTVDAGSVSDATLLPWVFHALADRAICVVAAESGLGHLAATRGRAILTLAGPTNARLWRPVTPHHWAVEAREFGSRRTEDIPLDAVVARIDEIVRWADFHSA